MVLLSASVEGMLFAQRDNRSAVPAVVTPLDFGLAEAETDSARYAVLYATHLQAQASGAKVSYDGLDTLAVEVTGSSLPIPLGRENDFGGLHLIVRNAAKTHCLFILADTLWERVELPPGSVDSGDFKRVGALADGSYMIVAEDLHPWVDNRAGYKYGAMRKDILLVSDGRALNRPISPYTTDSTLLAAKFHRADEAPKTISNLTITRDTSSSKKTYCFRIEGINNLKISNLTINTPDPKTMYADAAIDIANCTNLTLEDVRINGTYSQTNRYGYGICMDNVWNSTFVRLSARANWGVFGTNNLSNTTLRNCDINRFDIHCYGRDVFLYYCRFHDLYNQFSSLFGTLLFEECTFTRFVPVLFEPSYSAYTPFDLTFKNCTFEADASHYCLVSAGNLDGKRNPRPELARKCWPNVTIQNLTVSVPQNVPKIILFKPKSQSSGPVGHISSIKIDGLRFLYSDTSHLADFVISSINVSSHSTIHYDLKELEFIPSSGRMKRQAEKKHSYPGSIAFNLRHSKNDVIRISDSRLNFNVNTNSQYNIHFTNCEVGMIRYNSNTNGTKRHYNRCTLYLNNADDSRYYIDNQASYFKSTFIPCNDNMYISFYGMNNDVVIKNCKSTRKSKLFYQGQKDNIELRGYVVRGSEKYWR